LAGLTDQTKKGVFEWLMNILIAAAVGFSEANRLWACAAYIHSSKTSTNPIGVVNIR